MSRTKGAKNKPKLLTNSGDTPMPEVTQSTITIGGHELVIQTRSLSHVPTGQKIAGYENELSKLAYAVAKDRAVLIVGETGVGKTALIRYLAQETKNGFRRLNLNGQTTVDEFVGKIMLNDKGTFWQDGVLLDAMRNGYWLLLDEINASLPEILFVLHSLLDDDGYVVLAEKDGEVVKPHKDFRIFATMNPSGRYVGTKELNKAFLSRFPVILQMDFPLEKHERDIISLYAKVTDQQALNLVKMANDLRAAYKKGETNFMCSTRDLISCAQIAEDLGMGEAIQLCIINRCDEDDLKAVSMITSLYFGKTGKATKQIDYEAEYTKLKSRGSDKAETFANMLGSVQSSQKDVAMFMSALKPVVDAGYIGEAIKSSYTSAYQSLDKTQNMCATFSRELKEWGK